MKTALLLKQLHNYYFRTFWKLHGFSLSLTSDRGPQFISEVWKNLYKILGISANLFTSFHLETNRQSEIANQEMKRHFCTFVNYQQDD